MDIFGVPCRHGQRPSLLVTGSVLFFEAVVGRLVDQALALAKRCYELGILIELAIDA